MNINNKIAKFSSTLLEGKYFSDLKNLKKGDREDIIILVKLIFGDELADEDYPHIEDILHAKYLMEVI